MITPRIVILLFVLARLNTLGQQQPDSASFKEVTITANRLIHFSSGVKIQKIDSATINRYQGLNLGDLLANESALFIKSYGRGSLATSAFRGGSANHTAILWNGFNISSPMNGQSDLSLIPTNLSNNISIQYGGSSALWGSGAIGGTIHLNNIVKFNKGVSVVVNSSAGSFDDYRQSLFLEISKPRFVAILKGFNTAARNDFNFYNSLSKDSELRKQIHAELRQYGIISENYFLLNEKQKINLCFWYQHSDRNLPPTMLQLVSNARQKDESSRLTSEWKRIGMKTILSARIGYFNDYLNYSDIVNEIDGISKSHTLIGEVEAKISFNNRITFNGGINNTWEQAIAPGYFQKPKRNRISAFTSLQYNSKNNKSRTTFSLRQELLDHTLLPFTFSIGSEYVLFNWLIAKGNVAKVYRIPTLNDLYWSPGGNPTLIPESGFSGEAGLSLQWTSQSGKLSLQFEPTIFNRLIDNWILWLPGQAYWSPQNIMKVWSRGTETSSELGVRIKEFQFRFGLMTNYVVSTNEQTKTVNDASIDKQLIYVPMYSGNGKVSISYKNFSITYLQTYTGYRYTSTDNSSFLEPYTLASIHASYNMRLSQNTLSCFAQCNNLYDTTYEVMMSRPMPMRNYQIGLSLKFSRPNKN